MHSKTILGEEGDRMYYFLLLQGECGVYESSNEGERRLSGIYGTLREGSGFGEEGILFDTKRSATIIATKGSKDYMDYTPKAEFVDEPRVTLYRLNG